MRARIFGGAALAISVAAHAVGLVRYGEAPEQVAATSAPPMQAQFGTGFADLVTGTVVPAAPEVTDAPAPEEVQPPEPVEVTPEVAPVETAQAEPAPVLTQAESAAPAAPVAVGEAEPMTMAALVPLSPVTPTPPVDPAPVTPSVSAPITPSETAPTPVQPVAPPTVTQAETPPPEVIEAQPETVVQTPDDTDLRPVARPRDIARTPPKKTEPKKQPPKPAAVAAGNADRDEVRGAAAASTSAAPAANAGQGQTENATAATERKAAAAYPGKVNRKLSRTRKARSRSKGSAIVQFKVARNGGLSAVRILQSSGDTELDRLALDHTRRASPFPAPPAGAQTVFKYRYNTR
ncbi:energy transducer TonB family protein [Poseidonocella sedimentorum]|uniref:Outer membrane transport energization protein TonB n=1 Tax=Poseidonocella sedimentorum TaxID=871652 RepID=A0A1I6E4P1_9RHOB|nr:TonB family protein [Poseidonocella sedimentorum]SFR12683.1 outer membrane transport energization protein TonB [Poseidonocella sedimentorum]